MDVLDSGPIDGFVGYFDVQFRGSPQNPSDHEVRSAPSQAFVTSLLTRVLINVVDFSSYVTAPQRKLSSCSACREHAARIAGATVHST